MKKNPASFIDKTVEARMNAKHIGQIQLKVHPLQETKGRRGVGLSCPSVYSSFSTEAYCSEIFIRQRIIVECSF